MDLIDRQKTIVVVVNQAWSAWKFRSRLIGSLRASGYRIVTLVGKDEYLAELEKICDEVMVVPMARGTISILSDLLLLGAYVYYLSRLRPLAVLTFTIKPNIYASMVCRAFGLPAINNVTGMGTTASSSPLLSGLVSRMYRSAFSSSWRVFFQNPDDLEDMLTRNIVRADQAVLLPGSGVSTEYYAPTERMPGAHAEFHVSMLARLLREKGVCEFAEAARRIRRRHPNVKFHLWGKLDDRDQRSISRQELRKWESEGTLVFHGEARDAVEAFRNADVVILPSYYPEGTPRTLLEAASMGLPCITTDLRGCRDAVIDGVTGYTCKARDVDSLTRALERMIQLNTSERSKMGVEARRLALNKFDERYVIDAYLEAVGSIATAQA